MSEEHEGWIFGKHAVLEALAAGRPVERIYVSEDAREDALAPLRQAAADICSVTVSPRAALDRYAHGIRHQGVAARLAVVELVTFEEWFPANSNVESSQLVLIDSIEDPGNLGAIIRSAVVFGASAILVGSRRAPLSPTVARASAGNVFHIPIVKFVNAQSTITDLKNAGYWIYATAEESDVSILDVELPPKLVWVVGAEEHGVSAAIRKAADKVVSIPHSETARSLNASVAAGVVLFATFAARTMGKHQADE